MTLIYAIYHVQMSSQNSQKMNDEVEGWLEP